MASRAVLALLERHFVLAAHPLDRFDRTPPDVVIKPRNVRFGEQIAAPRWWHGGDPVATHLFNAFSASFPAGEQFFVAAAQGVRLDSPRLKTRLAAFAKQEARHSREHDAFNGHVAEAGYDLTAAEARARALLARPGARHLIVRLAVAVALEHFTAILAAAVIADPRYLEGAPRDIQALWRWHALEELEHKGVLFDALMAAGRSLPPLRRWLLRVVAMGFTTGPFVGLIGRNIADLLAQDGLDSARSRRRLAWLLIGRPGIARRVLLAYLAYYRPGFHPWRRDDRPLLAAAEAQLAAALP